MCVCVCVCCVRLRSRVLDTDDVRRSGSGTLSLLPTLLLQTTNSWMRCTTHAGYVPVVLHSFGGDSDPQQTCCEHRQPI